MYIVSIVFLYVGTQFRRFVISVFWKQKLISDFRSTINAYGTRYIYICVYHNMCVSMICWRWHQFHQCRSFDTLQFIVPFPLLIFRMFLSLITQNTLSLSHQSYSISKYLYYYHVRTSFHRILTDYCGSVLVLVYISGVYVHHANDSSFKLGSISQNICLIIMIKIHTYMNIYITYTHKYCLMGILLMRNK